MASSRIQAETGSSDAAGTSAQLVKGFGWNARTTKSRKSQWKSYLEFFESNGLAPIPVTEAHLSAFVGWMKVERVVGRRQIRSVPIAQYLTAGRQV